MTSTVVSNYLCELSKCSQRPQGILHTFVSVLKAWEVVHGSTGTVLTQDVYKLMDGLIKDRTDLPLQRTPVMPTAPFLALFHSWVENTSLELSQLHLKSLTLLTLSAMLRPSDVAPHSGHTFRWSMLTFREDGVLELYLHSFKNDYSRDGFRIFVQPANDIFVCRYKPW